MIKMEEAEAREMLASLLSCQRSLDQALVVSGRVSVEKEREIIQRVLKNAIADILTDIIMPLRSQHPSLDPYRDHTEG
jgi:DNA-nicking Smr family endonuclease